MRAAKATKLHAHKDREECVQIVFETETEQWLAWAEIRHRDGKAPKLMEWEFMLSDAMGPTSPDASPELAELERMGTRFNGIFQKVFPERYN